MKKLFSNIRIVLVETSHPGNIGAAARAMKNMNLSRLYLVNPKQFPHPQAEAMASGAVDILTSAQIVSSLEVAIADCQLVIGTSARLRAVSSTVVNVRECAERIVQEPLKKEIAILFGREATGLLNEEMQHCHYHIHIPTNEDYSSLNLAQAVQVVCYELYMCLLSLAAEKPLYPENELATDEEMTLFYKHLEEVLVQLHFLDPNNPKRLIPKLKRLYNRVQLEKAEINILRGILTETQKKIV